MTSSQNAADNLMNDKPSSERGTGVAPRQPERTSIPKYSEYILLGLCVFLFFFRLGSAPLFDLDEGLYVSAARTMVATGDWVTPTLNSRPMLRPHDASVPFYEKPILIYWSAAASMKLFGATEFAARLPAALASLITTICIYYAGRRWFGRRAGLLAAAVYATAPMTLADARQMTTDSLLVLTLTVGLMSFWESGAAGAAGADQRNQSETNRIRFPLLFWLMCGLAILVKGAVGLLLPVLVICVNVLFERLRFRFRWAGRAPGEFAFGMRWNRFSRIRQVIKRLRPLPGLLLLLCIAAPWHFAVAKTGKIDAEGRTFYREYIVRQHIGRFRGMDTVHNMPVFTYFGYFLLGFFPWACFAPTAFRSPNYEGSHVPENTEADPESKDADPFPWPSVAYVSKPEDAMHRFLLIWFWTIFVFFSIGAAKLPTYIVPAYPAAALLVGRWFDLSLLDNTRFRAMWRAVRGVQVVVFLLVVAAILAPSLISKRNPVPWSVIQAVQHLVAILAVGCTTAWLALRNGDVDRWRRTGIFALILTMAAVVGVAATEGYSAAGDALMSPYQKAARQARGDAASGVPIVFYNITPRRPSMLYYASTYSPIERKEAPLLPYLNTALPVYRREVDVVVTAASMTKVLAPEVKTAGIAMQELGRYGEGANECLLVRVVR